MRRTFARLVTCTTLIAGAIALVPASLAAQQQQQGPATPEAMQRAREAYQADVQREAIASNREGVVQGLMNRWRDDIGETPKGREGFEASFRAASPEKLLQLTQAGTWDSVVATLLGLNPDATLGSTSSDLVFTPITPCRVFDSRLAAGQWLGPFTTGQTISIYVTDPLTVNGHTQGGASSCGFPFAVGSAVALNITVVPISGSGDLKIFPFAGVSPTASIINFYAGLNLANATSAGIALANSTNDLSITVEFAASVHIIVDIMGYYASPQATALQNVRVASAATVTANGATIALDSPTCPAGYTMVGGGYNETAQISGLWVWQNGPADSPTTVWRFRGFNQTGGNTSLTVYGVCARVPGR